MATNREQIERFEVVKKWLKETVNSWKDHSRSRKDMKTAWNRWFRRKNKKIEEDESGRKSGRKEYSGYEY